MKESGGTRTVINHVGEFEFDWKAKEIIAGC